MKRLIACGLMIVAGAASAADIPAAGGAAPSTFYITNTVTINPTNAAAFAELKAQEASIERQLHELEVKINEVFYQLHETRTKAFRDDAELTALAREIQKKQEELEARAAAKYSALGSGIKERDTLTKAHSDLEKHLHEIHNQMDALRGLRPVEERIQSVRGK